MTSPSRHPALRAACPCEGHAGSRPDPAPADPIDLLIAGSEGRIGAVVAS